MKRYETYKDSGIQWLGEIPEHWKVVPLKFNLSLKARVGWKGLKSNEFEKDSYAYLVTGQDFTGEEIDWSKCYQIGKERYEEDPYIQIDNGDLLITKDGTIGKVSKVKNLSKPACLNSGIFVVKQKKNLYIQDYLYWFFSSNLLSEFNNSLSTSSTIQHLYQNVFENMPLLVLPISEQKNIVSYLDYTIGQANNLISAKEKQVEDLQQYRSSVISEAVTRGLNPDVEFKDSGVEWIGEIPKHWDVNLLKRYAEVYTGSTPSTSILDYWNNPTKNWYTPSDFSDDIHLFESDRKVSAKAYLDNACRVFPKDTVFVVGIGATLGKVGIVSSECSANQQINAIIFNDKVNPHYGAYYLYSKKDYMNAVANAATLPILNQSATKELAIVVPPFSEQQEIADYLDEKTSKIDETIKELKIQIDDLRQYKKSVISEAVTGKVDLRDWKPK